MNCHSIARANLRWVVIGFVMIALIGCEPADKAIASKPYKVVQTEDQLAQLLVQVVVPAGSTHEQVREWHRELQTEYGSRGKSHRDGCD